MEAVKVNSEELELILEGLSRTASESSGRLLLQIPEGQRFKADDDSSSTYQPRSFEFHKRKCIVDGVTCIAWLCYQAVRIEDYFMLNLKMRTQLDPTIDEGFAFVAHPIGWKMHIGRATTATIVCTDGAYRGTGITEMSRG